MIEVKIKKKNSSEVDYYIELLRIVYGDRLSNREREVLGYVLTQQVYSNQFVGTKNKRMLSYLNVRQATLQTYRLSLRRKGFLDEDGLPLTALKDIQKKVQDYVIKHGKYPEIKITMHNELEKNS